MGQLEANFSDILSRKQTFQYKKMSLEINSAKFLPFLPLQDLNHILRWVISNVYSLKDI